MRFQVETLETTLGLAFRWPFRITNRRFHENGIIVRNDIET